MTATSPHPGKRASSRRAVTGRPEAELILTEGRHGRWTVLTASGTLEMTTAARLIESVDDHIAATEAAGMPPTMVLDVSRVSFCDSSGINALVRSWHKANRAGGELVLLSPPAQLARLLKITGLDRRLPISPHLPD